MKLNKNSPANMTTVGLFCAALYVVLLYFRPLLEYLISGQIAIAGTTTQTVYIAILLLAALAFLSKAGVERTRGFRNAIFFLLAAVVSICISDLAANVSLASTTIPVLHALVGTWLTFIVLKCAFDTPQGAAAITKVLVVCASINSFVGLWGVVTKKTLFNVNSSIVGAGSFGYDANSGRSGGIVGENYVGMYDLPALIAGLYLISSKRWRPLGIVLVSLSAAAIVVSLSRTSVLSGLAAVFCFIMVTMTRKRSAILLVAVPLIAVYFGVGYINEQQTLHAGGPLMHSTGYRFSTEGIGNEDRLLFWKYYLGVAANNPIIGKGSGYILSQFSAGINVPHNSFLDIQVEYGCVGLILYFGVFALVARTWIRYRKKFSSVLPDLLFSCFCGITVSLMTLSNPLARLQWAVAGGVSGVCLWAGRRPRSVQTRLGSVYQALGMSGGIATGYSEFLSKNPNSWSARSKKVNL